MVGMIWVASIAFGTLAADVLKRTKWWVGAIVTTLLGPLGFALIALDVATYREAPGVSGS